MISTVFKRSLLAPGLALLAPLAAWSQVSISVNMAPPPLPLYAQPSIPGDGYLWTPGYWAWDPDDGDYTWVPGTWVMPPSEGLLWTPGYWAYANQGYGWHRGYWGSRVGYYGGLNYGYGYNGSGYDGGRWERGHFRYNSAVNNLPSGRVHDVYRGPGAQRPAPTDSFTGGSSHYRRPPSAIERRYEGAEHGRPTPEQMEHEHRALGVPEQRMGYNHGIPPTAATPRAGGFGDAQVEHVRPTPERHAQPVRPTAGERPQGGGERGGRPAVERPQGGSERAGRPAGERAPGGERGGRADGERR
jgi:hypothetical protein